MRTIRAPEALLLAFLLGPPAGWAQAEQTVPLLVSNRASHAVSQALDFPVSFPGETTLDMFMPTSTTWSACESLLLDLSWQDIAPTQAQVLVHMKDRDYFWYETLLPGRLTPDRRTPLRVDLTPDASGWRPRGHYASWHYRALARPREFAFRIFSDETFTGSLRIHGVSAQPRQTAAPISVRNVQPAANRVACYDRFALSFRLPDRYLDPFDAEQVSAEILIRKPDGAEVAVDAFYTRDYFRTVDQDRETILPQGDPYWQARFTPAQPGIYHYRIVARDATGTATWGPAVFEATPATAPGFIRVSKRDPRFFAFSDGSTCFPIGHNIRSPFDTRMDKQFPWADREPMGSLGYKTYFEQMRQHGENMAEIWTAAWSLGLEWSETHPGYHGIGQYNMRHAWELDRVLERARRNGIYVNLVIHNHGKFSTFSDPEWRDNPFRSENGGYLEKPEAYFSDPRALRDFRKLMRYMVARWGYSPNLFAWQLWSELDLTGSKRENHKRQETVDWHRLMGRYIREIDPYDHLIATHTCGDYNHQNPAIVSLPEMTHAPVDAYHGSGLSTYIVDLMRRTAEYNSQFEKPVLITEFGGSPSGQSVSYLRDTLHAAVWATTGIPIAGTPLLWWWQVIHEENFYPIYQAFQRFMDGEEKQRPGAVMVAPRLAQADTAKPPADVRVVCLADDQQATGWIYRHNSFSRLDPYEAEPVPTVTCTFDTITNGLFQVEFWDTLRGQPVHRAHQTADGAGLVVTVPPFARDIAFKVRPDPR